MYYFETLSVLLANSHDEAIRVPRQQRGCKSLHDPAQDPKQYFFQPLGTSREPFREPSREPSLKGTLKGILEGTLKGTLRGTLKGTLKGILEGTLQGTLKGTLTGTLWGTLKGTFPVVRGAWRCLEREVPSPAANSL